MSLLNIKFLIIFCSCPTITINSEGSNISNNVSKIWLIIGLPFIISESLFLSPKRLLCPAASKIFFILLFFFSLIMIVASIIYYLC